MKINNETVPQTEWDEARQDMSQQIVMLLAVRGQRSDYAMGLALRDFNRKLKRQMREASGGRMWLQLEYHPGACVELDNGEVDVLDCFIMRQEDGKPYDCWLFGATGGWSPAGDWERGVATS
jgi:hypothetical protein